MIAEVLRTGGVRSVFQPIVELQTGKVVAYEALARGPEGPLSSPVALFDAARAAGCLAELDAACRAAAMRGATEQGLLAPLTLFVNVEPEVLDTAALHDLLAVAEGASGDLRVVLEITERALAKRPAELLRTVERVRELGWGLALDDVGAEAASLAFMPLLRPDVVKLDLRLVQERPGPAVAEIMNAVNAYAERSGALVLAEGIETDHHLRMAGALGATLGQGWMFGRPGPGAARGFPTGELVLPCPPSQPSNQAHLSPFACLPEGTALRRSPKSLLVELSKQLEREAMRLGETCVVAATFQEARHFTAATAQRYRDLVDRTGFVCALGDELSAEPVPGVRGATLALDDPVRGEWDLVVISPHFSVALLARDLGSSGPDMDRMFEYALTYQRDVVAQAATAMLSRVVPRVEEAAPPRAQVTAGLEAGPLPGGTRAGPVPGGKTLLHRALAATSSGVTIVDMRRPDQPLVYVNSAFERLSGVRADDLLGRNCRFLQGPDSDAAAVARIRAAVAAGQECRETLLNYRGPDRLPWWNEVYLAPVTDAGGAVLQYIGVQNDVTARVTAERGLLHERDRARSYLARIEQLAYTDHLTGLLNRRRLEERVEVALWDARTSGDAVALLVMDLDGFKVVNDQLGHAAGDELLRVIGSRLQSGLRRRDHLARLGGDEFLIALLDLDPGTARAEAQRIADVLEDAVAAPMTLNGQQVTIHASIGVAICPGDADDFGSLLHHADMRMYDSKRPSPN